MKPLKLTMSAFGPYSSLTEIDFEKDIGSDGIFLVTGDTGAGKTTIFDAISFALYGDPSGGKDRRDTKSFRSDYAKLSDPTYVEYTFAHHGQTYVVKRNPDYEREKKSGSGITKEKASAEFKCIETGELLDGPKEVSNRCVELLGLTREQFSQTVMIAQGDFRKILTEKSETRKQLFQQIFKTQIYASLQAKLLAMKKSCEDQDNAINSGIESAFSRIRLEPEFDATTPFLGEAKFLETVILDLTNMVKSEGVKLNNFTKELESAEKDVTTFTTAIAKGEEINKDIKNLETLKKTLSELNSKKKEMDDLRGKLEAGKRALPVLQYVKLQERITKEFEKLSDYILENENKEKEAKKNHEAATNSLERAKEEFSKYDELMARVTSLSTAIESLSSKEKTEKEFESHKEKLNAALSDSKKADEEYTKVKEAYYRSQYGLIAEELEDNSPCPVCGSPVHPSPAVLPEVSATQADFDNADEKRKHAEQKLKEESEKNTKLESSLKEIEASIKKLGLELDVTSNSVKTEMKELKDKALNLKASYEKAQKDEKKALEILSGVTETLKTQKSSLAEQKEELNSCEKELNNSLKEHGFKSIEELERAKLSEAEITSLENEIAEYSKEIETTKQLIKSLDEKTKGQKLQDLEKLREKLKEAVDSKNAINKERTSMNTKFETNSGILKELEKYKKEKASMADTWAIIKELSDTVSGQKSGAVKLSFETYVQQYYFRQVISAANKRLVTLTGGMFTLRCKQVAKDMRSQAGLDLDVYDKSTGHWRDVTTLSGGESFLASLALALGMSDVVQAGSGGIRLDSMFIDEGFGTLDEEALQKAVSLLVDLADGKRLIGVISHRPELKERIEKQIVIKKKITGSEITIA